MAAATRLTNFTMLLTILTVTLLVTISVCYAIAVKLGHVPVALPYISEAGSKVPESCIFGLGLNIASFLYMLAVYLRYRELKDYCAMTPQCRISSRLNRIAMWIGCVSAGGLCLVANFQVGNVPQPHYIGAISCFFGGSIYFGLQAWFSKHMCPAVSSKEMVHLRIALTVLSAIAIIVCIGAGLVAIPQFDGTDQVDWRPENKGYAMHCLSTAAEWLVAVIFVSSIVTYIPEMRAISVRPPAFRIAVTVIEA